MDKETEHGSGRTSNNDVYRPEWVAIEKSSTGFFLLTIDAKGWEFIETSHSSVGEAMAEALDQFGVMKDAWAPVTEKNSGNIRDCGIRHRTDGDPAQWSLSP